MPQDLTDYMPIFIQAIPDSKIQGANVGPTWGRQDPGGPHVGPMNLAIWDGMAPCRYLNQSFIMQCGVTELKLEFSLYLIGP